MANAYDVRDSRDESFYPTLLPGEAIVESDGRVTYSKLPIRAMGIRGSVKGAQLTF